ncbi:MAG: hypothetical protein KBD01_13985 [Acidobacteria bacterium]|nr:hypothetical protein [Acidobacteriota bacterium]
MNRTLVATALALLVAAALPAAAAETEVPFDLRVQIDVTPELSAQLRSGDLLQVVLRPEIQYGQRSVPGAPIVLEKAWEPGMLLEPLHFPKVLAPDQIYRVELRIARKDDKGRTQDLRYLSALDKLPRHPVTRWVPMRLHLGDRRDLRDNHVMVVQDSDGIFRVMWFTA